MADAPAEKECCRRTRERWLAGMAGPGGSVMQAAGPIGDSIVVSKLAFQEPPQPALLVLSALDVDKTFAKAVKAGAKVLRPVQDRFWGERFGRVEDPSGNRWG